jgi:hypothetical protein
LRILRTRFPNEVGSHRREGVIPNGEEGEEGGGEEKEEVVLIAAVDR